MRFACCQLNPKWGERQENMAKADAMLARFTKGDIDVLVLPEMAFTGYVFHTKDEVEPFLEDTRTGPTVHWAQRQAQRLRCYVAAGYPERHVDESSGQLIYYNSLCFVDREGRLLKTYRKSFLYETDENWAQEGRGFDTVDLEDLGKVGFGICMDINPYQFKADFWDMEFASFHARERTDVLLCSMAWLQSRLPSDKDDGPKEKDVINYWATRLMPLMAKDTHHRTLFVACNRIGTERGSTFAGASAVLELSGDRKAILLGYLKENEEDVLVVDMDQE
ncbi:carbon-nitrogen hydrolase [Gongronella butleri]|nr:carbon-nitrogen hydrolase [Gongronella butleri]